MVQAPVRITPPAQTRTERPRRTQPCVRHDKTLVLAPGIAAGSKVDVTYHAGAQGTVSEIATAVALHK